MADDFSLLEDLDGYSAVRNGLRRVADRNCDWAGIPMPIDGQRLVIEPTFPNGQQLAEIGAEPADALPDDVHYRNSWWSRRLRAEIYIWEEGGKVLHAILPTHPLSFMLGALGCSVAWGIEQEARATQLLGTLVRHNQFKQYLLTGMFLETSKRSGLTYLFRRLRPTVVIDARVNERDRSRILCALCMHPIAYYRDTFAGAMTPTDDVVAHLMLMRGDEPMFWRRSSQHRADRPEAAL